MSLWGWFVERRAGALRSLSFGSEGNCWRQPLANESFDCQLPPVSFLTPWSFFHQPFGPWRCLRWLLPGDDNGKPVPSMGFRRRSQRLECLASSQPSPRSNCRRSLAVALQVGGHRLVFAARLAARSWTTPEPAGGPIPPAHRGDIGPPLSGARQAGPPSFVCPSVIGCAANRSPLCAAGEWRWCPPRPARRRSGLRRRGASGRRNPCVASPWPRSRPGRR